jgi:hypothetical protein
VTPIKSNTERCWLDWTPPGSEDIGVIAGVFALAMTAGALVFDYRERTR